MFWKFDSNHLNPNASGADFGISAPLNEALLLEVLDQMDYGIALVEDNGDLRYSNQVAGQMLTEGSVLGVVDTRVAAVVPNCQLQWRRALVAAGQGKRSLVLLEGKSRTLTAATIPLEHSDTTRAGRLVLVALERSQTCEQITLSNYSSTMGLTPAEARVLERLAAGLSPTQVASENSVSTNTIRYQIKSVLSKTRRSGIRELLARVSKMPPIRCALKTQALSPPPS